MALNNFATSTNQILVMVFCKCSVFFVDDKFLSLFSVILVCFCKERQKLLFNMFYNIDIVSQITTLLDFFKYYITRKSSLIYGYWRFFRA